MRDLVLRRPAPLLAVLAAALLTALLVLLPAGRASAHDELVAADPAVDSRVETLPEQISLTFSGAITDAPAGTAVVVTDAAGRSVATGDPQINGAIVSQALDTADAASGTYTVQWAIVSGDGHPTSGEYSFTVTTGPAPAAPDAPADGPDMTSQFSISPAWMIGIAVVVLIAVVVVIAIVIRRRGSAPRD